MTHTLDSNHSRLAGLPDLTAASLLAEWDSEQDAQHAAALAIEQAQRENERISRGRGDDLPLFAI